MNWPKPPSILSPIGSWLDRLLKACISHQLLSGPGYRIKRSPGGTFLELLPAAGGAASTPATNFRGVWTANPTAPYMANQEVVIQAGPAKGTYVSVIDNNANDPATGIGWVQTAPGNTVGAWA
jgi:hypothetical protein